MRLPFSCGAQMTDAQGQADSSPEDQTGGAAPARRRSRRKRRTILLVVLSLLVLWVAASAVDVLLAARHVQQGADQVQAARGSLSADGLLSGAPLAPLRSAESNFSSAHGLLSSPLLWPVDVLPFLGRQLRSVQDLAVAAGHVATTGVGAASETKALLKLPHNAGPERIVTLHRLGIVWPSSPRPPMRH
jgi:hypothetical protein